MSLVQTERIFHVLSHGEQLRTFALTQAPDVCHAYFSVHIVIFRAFRDPACPATAFDLRQALLAALSELSDMS